jgi:hypothetical protein
MSSLVLRVFITGAGNREVHSPVVNAAGRYLVRMFYLGSCGITSMDGYLPVDGKRSASQPTAMRGN